MAVLGIDPSLTATGCIRLENGGKILGRQLIKTKPTDSIRGELERLQYIRDSIILDDVEIALIEGLALGTIKTQSIVQLAGLNYLLREHFLLCNIPFIIVAPTQLKRFITGNGVCKKELMLLEVYKRYNISFNDNNICDSYALARIGEALLYNKKVNKLQDDIIINLKKQYAEFKSD